MQVFNRKLFPLALFLVFGQGIIFAVGPCGSKVFTLQCTDCDDSFFNVNCPASEGGGSSTNIYGYALEPGIGCVNAPAGHGDCRKPDGSLSACKRTQIGAVVCCTDGTFFPYYRFICCLGGD